MAMTAIVGPNGFIGRHLTNSLASAGKKLVLFGRSGDDLFPDMPQIPWQTIEPEVIRNHLRDVDTAYYLASETIPASSWNTPVQEIEKNLVPFIRFMEHAAAANIRKIILLSSAGTIYGACSGRIPEHADKHPYSPHGIAKLTMEHFLEHYHVRCGIRYIVFRISNVFGAGQDISKGLGLINTFIEKILKGGHITVFGDGKNVRNFIYIDDVVRLLTQLADANETLNQTFNLASNDALSINQVIALLKKVADRDFRVEYLPARQSDIPTIEPDNTKLRGVCPDFRFTPIEEGIRRTYDAIKAKLA